MAAKVQKTEKAAKTAKSAKTAKTAKSEKPAKGGMTAKPEAQAEAMPVPAPKAEVRPEVKTEAEKLIERVDAIQKELAAQRSPSEDERVFTEEAVAHFEEMLREQADAGRDRRYKGGRYFR